MVQRRALRRLLEPLEAIVMCCNTCANFEGGWCCRYNAEPPKDLIDTDIECESWDHDPTPF